MHRPTCSWDSAWTIVEWPRLRQSATCQSDGMLYYGILPRSMPSIANHTNNVTSSVTTTLHCQSGVSDWNETRFLFFITMRPLVAIVQCNTVFWYVLVHRTMLYKMNWIQVIRYFDKLNQLHHFSRNEIFGNVIRTIFKCSVGHTLPSFWIPSLLSTKFYVKCGKGQLYWFEWGMSRKRGLVQIPLIGSSEDTPKEKR